VDELNADPRLEDDSIFALHADFCQVFSDEKRLRIMWFLGDSEHSVTEIAAHLGATLQNTSQHLRVMRDKGAVAFRKVGQSVLYSIANPRFLEGARMIRQGLLEELQQRTHLG
jgi:DNA-binding transcriptional ArsR family regulator